MTARAAILIGILSLARASYAQYGGDEEGSVDAGAISVITTDSVPISEGSAYDIWRDANPGAPQPDIMVMYNNDPAVDIGGLYTITINEGKAIGLATVREVTPATRVSSLLGQEFGHHWVRGPFFSSGVSHPGLLPDDVITIDEVTPDDGSPGLLVDTSRDLSLLAWRGDKIKLMPPAGGTLNFTVLSLSDADTIRFGFASGAQSSYVPQDGTRYIVETHEDEIIGRANHHWSRNFDTEGSYLDGNDWRDDGDDPGSSDPLVHLFTKVGSGFQYGPQDLHLMGLKPISELSPAFVVKGVGDADDQTPISAIPVGPEDLGNDVHRGIPRTLTPQQVFGDLGFPQAPQNTANWTVKWVIVTSIDNPVEQSEIDALDRTRRQWMAEFQNQTLAPNGEIRGTLTDIIAAGAPDLSVSRLTVPQRAESGESIAIQVDVHNQSTFSSSSTYLTVHTLPGPSSPRTYHWVPALDAHEISTRNITFSVPSESSLFGSASYQGSFGIKITLDYFGQVPEGDEANEFTADVAYVPSTGNDTTGGGAGQIVAGPVLGDDHLWVARGAAGVDPGIERISIDNPLDPISTVLFEPEDEVTAIAARDDLLVVGTFDAFVRTYSLPLALPASPVAELLLPGFSLPVQMDVLGSTLYVGTLASTLRVIEGLSSSEDTLAFGPTLSLPGIPTGLLVVGSGSNAKLYVAASSSVQEYSLATPTNPTLNQTFTASTAVADFSVTSTRLYTVTGMGETEVFDLSTAIAVATSPFRATSVVTVGDYLLLFETDTWTLFDITQPTPVKVGSVTLDASVVPPPLSGANLVSRKSTEVNGWAVLADPYGLRLFSPAGTETDFIRGDANADGAVNISDTLRIRDFAILGTYPRPFGLFDAYDANDDGYINIWDIDRITDFLFSSGPPPPSPFPNPGPDPTQNEPWEYARPKGI